MALRVYGRWGYLADQKQPPSRTVGPCLWPYGGPRGVGFYHKRGTPVRFRVYGLGLRSCRLLIVPFFRGSSRFESLIVSHHSRFTCECNRKEINDDAGGLGCGVWGSGCRIED